ncbi:MAG: LuxR C-terminal-related transcriptional regulator [Sphingomonadaceae bacterium]
MVDADVRRRATISFFLADVVAHVEPCETIEDLRNLDLDQIHFVFVIDSGNLIERVTRLAAEVGTFQIIGYVEDLCHHRVVDAMRSGTVDYLKWPFTHDEIVKRIISAKGYRSLLTGLHSRQIRAMRRISKLSPRELEVLDLVSDGLSSKEIARSLDLSPRTVDIHRANMLIKLSARNTTEAVRIALESRLLPDDRRTGTDENAEIRVYIDAA